MQTDKNLPLVLKIITQEGALPEVYCDSIRVDIAEDTKGRGDGSYGIRKGHAEALLALGKGKIRACENGKEIFSHPVNGGFATISKNIITVLG